MKQQQQPSAVFPMVPSLRRNKLVKKSPQTPTITKNPSQSILKGIFTEVEIEGFEPSLTEPESVVLPLHHISILFRHRNGLQNYNSFGKNQKNYLKINTVAHTSQPSRLPTKPRCSVVVALTLILSMSVPMTSASFSLMSGTL